MLKSCSWTCNQVCIKHYKFYTRAWTCQSSDILQHILHAISNIKRSVCWHLMKKNILVCWNLAQKPVCRTLAHGHENLEQKPVCSYLPHLHGLGFTYSSLQFGDPLAVLNARTCHSSEIPPHILGARSNITRSVTWTSHEEKNPVCWSLAQNRVCSYLAHGPGIRFILMYTIMRRYTHLKCMNMEVKWHSPSHITCKIKLNKIWLTWHEWEIPGMFKYCANASMVIFGTWKCSHFHITPYKCETVQPQQIRKHEHDSPLTKPARSNRPTSGTFISCAAAGTLKSCT